jgi:hypothetical protein
MSIPVIVDVVFTVEVSLHVVVLGASVVSKVVFNVEGGLGVLY